MCGPVSNDPWTDVGPGPDDLHPVLTLILVLSFIFTRSGVEIETFLIVGDLLFFLQNFGFCHTVSPDTRSESDPQGEQRAPWQRNRYT